MSKYQTGDRFWFEIADVYEAGGKTIYDCSNGGFCVDPILDGFERLDPDEKANADYDEGYAEGLRELWGAIETGLGMSMEDRMKYLGHHYSVKFLCSGASLF